jgi:hypothetical protein
MKPKTFPGFPLPFKLKTLEHNRQDTWYKIGGKAKIVIYLIGVTSFIAPGSAKH